MVPEGLQEGAASSAPEPTADGNPEAEAEAAESAEVAVEGSTGFSWADASEGATAPEADFAEAGGAAFGALGDVAEEDDLPRFDALSLLDTVKPEEPEVTAEDVFQALEAEPASETVVQPVASDIKEEADFTEVDNSNPQETEGVADSAAEPILGSSPTLEEAHDPNSGFAPVYVEYPAEAAEEDSVLPQAPQQQVTCRLVIRQLHHQDHPASAAQRVARKNKQNV